MRPKEGDPVQRVIANDPTFSPFFDNCIGALDAVRIHAFVGTAEHSVFRDRMKNIIQNVLGVVNLDMTFSYVLTDWKGSANDGRVLEDAKMHGKFFLGDGGYALASTCLPPFRGVRYHLKEFQASNAGGPRNAKELFNLKHTSLRNVVERSFGVIKKRFPILVVTPSFNFQYQCELVSCCVLIHNFIRRNQLYLDEFDRKDEIALDVNDYDLVVEKVGLVGNALNQWRNRIANSMRLAYQAHQAANLNV